ncbi:MAG: peptidylprolyl isomerase, partial [Pirellulales bacterium]|nr:peptidylprolyl isomerase [Pirellulales bacterium]
MRCLSVLAALGFCLATTPAAGQKEKYAPEDPIAAVDGEPIYLGEMNLVLGDRLGSVDLDQVDAGIKQATAALLVRRHLAFKSLRNQGGQALQAMVDRQLKSLADEARRLGRSLQQHAESRSADEKSLRADIAWKIAWSQYLKSRLTDENLRQYFQRHQKRYSGGRWRVSQLFVEVDVNDLPAVAQTQRSLEKLAQQITASGAPETEFAEAARLHSDAGSAPEGGRVGWVENDGDLPTAVMEAVRQAEIGKVTPPVRSPLGLHLVLVHEYEPGKISFDELADQSQLRRDAADALFEALIRRSAAARVTWFIDALKPPANIPIIPDRPTP